MKSAGLKLLAAFDRRTRLMIATSVGAVSWGVFGGLAMSEKAYCFSDKIQAILSVSLRQLHLPVTTRGLNDPEFPDRSRLLNR